MVENTGVEIPYCIFWISWCVQKKIKLKYFGRNYTSNNLGASGYVFTLKAKINQRFPKKIVLAFDANSTHS